MTEHEFYMNRAIQLARGGIFGAPPNPLVGAVIVHQGRIIGEGFHRKCGSGHAEVNAFRSVTQPHLLPQSRLYVTLEPCSHYGKTPPCANLIIEKGVKEVYIGCQDPFSKVNGAGIQMLRNAGIKVTVGILEQQCKELINHFLTHQLTTHPYIFLKWAQSSDGFIDVHRTPNERPTQLSSARSLLRVHYLRTQYQAIMVGTRTALMDNPRLNARLASGPQPLRIALDRNGILPPSLHFFDGSQSTLICGAYNPPQRAALGTYRFLELDYSKPILPPLLKALKQMNIQSLMVEGGATLLNHFIQGGLWNEIQVEQSPVVLQKGVVAPSIPVQYSAQAEATFGTTYLHYFKY